MANPVDYLKLVFIAISAWGVMPSVQEDSWFQEAAEAGWGNMRPGWHPVKHGGILP
ncbi:hypothetical protein [Escherichia coli]|uniref:hypothetical protein n=1 Tax=Escherichia coli TaxID=562 RepID=UPI00163CFF16|nr:hypothetical protein [Escherichia coli]